MKVPTPNLAGSPTLAMGVDVDVLNRGAVPQADARPVVVDVPELCARIIIVVLFSFMAMRIGADFLQTGRLTGLLLLASETLVVIMTVFRRPSTIVDRSLRARVITTLSLLGPPLVRPGTVAALAPETMTVALGAAGLLVVIAGKISLGRSFGLIPANRGIVSSGIYRLVRHPIYLGYLITHAGFVLANPTMWNILAITAADLALMVRAVCEEQTLALDSAYRDYQTRVRWRVVPGVF